MATIFFMVALALSSLAHVAAMAHGGKQSISKTSGMVGSDGKLRRSSSKSSGPLEADFFSALESDRGGVSASSSAASSSAASSSAASSSAASPDTADYDLDLLSWQERTIITNLTCADPGCVAHTVLQAFDSKTEHARNCKLTLDVHPTDFDDQYSGERLTWVRVNDVLVNQDCFPMISACNRTTQLPTFSCFNDLPLSDLFEGADVFKISAMISDVVDECPFEGNLLSAVPKVTCLVASKQQQQQQQLQQAAQVDGQLPVEVQATVPWPKFVVAMAGLKCASRGCTAHARLDPVAISEKTMDSRTLLLASGRTLNFSKCLLNVRAYNTDFDQEQGTVETIEYLKVGGKVTATNMSSGKNPCTSEWHGSPLPPQEMMFELASNLDVTDMLSEDGRVPLEAKLSDWVDECAYEGFLLNAVAYLNCSVVPFGVEHANAAKPAALYQHAGVAAPLTLRGKQI